MSKNVVLTDRDGNQVLPVTTADNVKISPGLTLANYLDGQAGTAPATASLAANGVTATTVANATYTPDSE